MKLSVIVSSTGCQGGTCPTVYHTDSGTVAVQGPNITRRETPTGEVIAEIPEPMLLAAADRIRALRT